MMKLRLAGPDLLIDINELSELHGIAIGADEVTIGAATTHATLEHHPALAETLPLIPLVAHQIADPTVRNRGTLGGSLAHADPSADWPAAMLALDARIDVTGATGSRSIAAADFFEGLFTTALRPSELIVAVRIPVLRGVRAAYRKFRHPASGYAVVGVAVVLRYERGACSGGQIAVTGFTHCAFRPEHTEALLAGVAGQADRIERPPDPPFADLTPPPHRFAHAEDRPPTRP